jgi:hypothetical protein
VILGAADRGEHDPAQKVMEDVEWRNGGGFTEVRTVEVTIRKLR